MFPFGENITFFQLTYKALLVTTPPPNVITPPPSPLCFQGNHYPHLMLPPPVFLTLPYSSSHTLSSHTLSPFYFNSIISPPPNLQGNHTSPIIFNLINTPSQLCQSNPTTPPPHTHSHTFSASLYLPPDITKFLCTHCPPPFPSNIFDVFISSPHIPNIIIPPPPHTHMFLK